MRVLDPRSRCDWVGFEGIIELVKQLRPRLELATQLRANLSWFVRMDPQITHVYGSAGWAAARYGAIFDTLAASGDEIGLHVHPWQWHDDGHYWMQNFADQSWVSQCVESAFSAFELSFGRSCQSFRFGDHWMNDATIDLLERLGAICDLTVEPGLMNTTVVDAFTGTFPDYSNVPRLPYRPSPGAFTTAASSAEVNNGSLCMIPVSTVPTNWATTHRAKLLPAEHFVVRTDVSVGCSVDCSAEYEGTHDAATTDAIEGWVWDRNQPERHLDVDVLCDDEVFATVGATGYRPDLEAAGKADGKHSFRLATPSRINDGRQHEIRVRVTGTDTDLANTPRILQAPAGCAAEFVTVHLDLPPGVFAPMVDRLLMSLLTSPSPAVLSLPVRSDAGCNPWRRANLVRNVNHLLSHRLSDRFAFMTPCELLDSWRESVAGDLLLLG